MMLTTCRMCKRRVFLDADGSKTYHVDSKNSFCLGSYRSAETERRVLKLAAELERAIRRVEELDILLPNGALVDNMVLGIINDIRQTYGGE